jgi:putative transposase
MKRHGRPEELVTDRLPLRRRERVMLRFRRMHGLQKCASIHSSVTNHFNADRRPTSRGNHKAARTAALAEWRQVRTD